jgi:hypothetical protein
MVDNFDIIKPLLTFDNEYEFYFLQVLQRKKDHKDGQLLKSNNNSRLIKAYYIYSQEQLDKYKDEIISLCQLFNARAGIGLNKRDARVISLEALSLLAMNIKTNHIKQLGSLYNTVCGQHFVGKDKCWILDVDEKDFNISTMRYFLEQQKPEGEKLLAVIPSKNGWHVITKPFDPRDFAVLYPEVEIHKNNPTNLYIP